MDSSDDALNDLVEATKRQIAKGEIDPQAAIAGCRSVLMKLDHALPGNPRLNSLREFILALEARYATH